MAEFGEPEEHWISATYLSALINGDYSSFDYYYDDEGERDDAITVFDDWVEEASAGRSGHWSTPSEDENDKRDEFGECEVTGLRGSVELVTFHPPIEG